MEIAGFFCQNLFIAIPETIKVRRNYIWLCDFMFCNTYILFFEFFMCKVLRLGFFYYNIIFIFFNFGLGPELETDLGLSPTGTPLST
jgi:hypothetical protein